MKKKILALGLALGLALSLTACGGSDTGSTSSASEEENSYTTNENGEVVDGADWHTWAAYDTLEWHGPDETRTIYVEYLDDCVRLLADEENYRVIADCMPTCGVIQDQDLVQSTICFEDRYDDGYDDLVFHDIWDGNEREYVFLYQALDDTFVLDTDTEVDGEPATGDEPYAHPEKYVGTWTYDGEVIVINEDLTLTATFDGTEEYTGYLASAITWEEDNSVSIWYLVETNEESTVFSFPDDGTDNPTTFYAEGNEEWCYTKTE